MNEPLKLRDMSFYRDKFIYKVESGDTLFSLAEKFCSTVQAIVAENSLDGELERGQLIIIPKLKGVKRIVRPKEDVYDIADGDEKLAFEIMKKNEIRFVYVGQTIYV